MTQSPSRSSLSRRVARALSSLKSLVWKRLFRTSIYESIRPSASSRMGWLETLSSLIAKGSENVHQGGVLKVSAKERAKRSAAREFRRRFVMAEQLELRALMAADLGLDSTLSQQTIAAEVGAAVPGQFSQPVGSVSEVVFVDPGVTDPQSLMQGLRAGVEFVMLDGSQDGIDQIAAYLEGKSGIQAIHLVGHGRAGEIYLGSSVLGNGTLSQYAGELAQVGGALTSDGDILVYGCETAQGDLGKQFLQQLARLTSADVAGSNDITGAANLGGDWDLESVVGAVATPVFALASDLAEYPGALGTPSANSNFPTTFSGTTVTIPINSINPGTWDTVTSGNANTMSFTIQAFRNGGATASGSFTANAPNPLISNLNTPTALANSGLVTLSGSANGNNNNARTTNATAMTAALGASGYSFTYSIPAGTTSIRFRLTATDTGGTSFVDRTLSAPAAPVLTIANATNPSFTEDAGAINVAPNATVTDTDSADLTSMTITLVGVAGRPQDVESLSYTTVGGITGSYVPGTGVLALSGTTTVANYQSVLRSLQYNNTSQNPTAGNRSVTVVASDGTLSSTPVTATLTVTPVNDAPTVSAPATFTLTEDTTGNLLYTGTPFADVDSASLTVTLSVADGSINATGNANVLVGGSATARTFNGTTANLNAFFTTAGNITYTPAANNTTARTLTTTASDGNLSGSATSTINITAVNDAPAVFLGGGTTLNVLRLFTENGGALAVAPDAIIADVDSTQLQSLTISLTNAQDGSAEVLAADAGSTGLDVSLDGSVLTISNAGSLADYQSVLRTLTYNNTSANPTTNVVRTITVVARDNEAANSLNSATSTASISLTAVNNPPVYNTGLENQNVTNGLPFSFSYSPIPKEMR
jgi:hypothetical protein